MAYTGQDIYTLVEQLVHDLPPQTWFIAALNAAKDRIESERDWEFLKKYDSSKTRSAGDTISSTKALPTDFARPLKVTVGTATSSFNLIPFEEREVYKDEEGAYVIDYGNSTFAFTGTCQTAGTIKMFYLRFTPDVSLSTSPVWPDRFHRVLALDVAKQWFYQDQGEREFSWSSEMDAEAKLLKDAMVAWDERIKALSLNSPSRSPDPYFIPDIS